MACATLQRCYEDIQGRADAIAAANPRATRSERQQLLDPLNAEMPQCIQEGYERGLAVLANRQATAENE